MSTFDPRLEQLAEAVVFAHEPDAATLTADPELDGEIRELERTAALFQLASAGREAVPARLEGRLAAAGLAFCSERRRQAPGAADLRAVPRPAGGPLRAVGAFLLGAAATAALWLGLGLGSDQGPSAAERRAALLADPAVRRLAWQKGPSPLSGAVDGDVVWSEDRQQGYLRFRGLPPLDRDHRFQLWIVDAARPGSAPVDGGLFDVPAGAAETLVPVDPKLPIGKAAAFVVTVEERQGAVVSKQEHVVAVAGL